ncbi:hypothetical protein YC2023_011478 [Brassica napus]
MKSLNLESLAWKVKVMWFAIPASYICQIGLSTWTKVSNKAAKREERELVSATIA